MTADPNPNHLPAVLEQLQQADPDLLRSMLTAFVQALMSADADTACGAEYGTRSPDRVNQRNGYRHPDWDTRAGTIELAIPKLREGSYFPDWLLERRKRAERALVSVVATSYPLGVSTRRMEKLVETCTSARFSTLSSAPPRWGCRVSRPPQNRTGSGEAPLEHAQSVTSHRSWRPSRPAAGSGADPEPTVTRP